VRTIIAPLHPEVEAELPALDRKRADIARRYIRRLRLEPDLGVLTTDCSPSMAVDGSTSTTTTSPTTCSGRVGRRRATATGTSAMARGGGSSTGPGQRCGQGPACSRPRGRTGAFAAACRERLRDGATATRTSSQNVPKRKEDEVNAYLVTGPAYHRLMCDDGLPHPAVGLRLSEIGQQQDRVLKMLEQGGAEHRPQRRRRTPTRRPHAPRAAARRGHDRGDDRHRHVCRRSTSCSRWTTAASCRSGHGVHRPVWVHPGVDTRLDPLSSEHPRVQEVLRFEDPRSAHSRAAVRSSAGATAPRERPSASTATKCYPQSTASGGTEAG
jgi:hypothetical protein